MYTAVHLPLEEGTDQPRRLRVLPEQRDARQLVPAPRHTRGVRPIDRPGVSPGTP